jgi:hypothetical protein
MDEQARPASREAAIAQGYHDIADLAEFLGPVAARKSHDFKARLAPPVDCQVSPRGTLCFDQVFPGQGRVVGYCDGNGQCHLMAKPGH